MVATALRDTMKDETPTPGYDKEHELKPQPAPGAGPQTFGRLERSEEGNNIGESDTTIRSSLARQMASRDRED